MRIWRLLSVTLLTLASLTLSPSPSRSEGDAAAGLPFVIATINVGLDPSGIGIDETRNLVYVSNSLDQSVGVSKIDGATLAVSNFSTAVANPVGVAVDSAGNRVLVANHSQPLLSILRGVDGTLESTPAVGMASFGITYNPASGKAYVASFDSNKVVRVNLADNGTQDILVRGNPVWVALDTARGRAFATVWGSQVLSVIDLNTDQQTGEWAGDFGDVSGIAVNQSNGDVFVANAHQGAVTVKDANNQLKGALNIGQPSGQPRGIAINPNTGHVFVTRYDTNSVYVFDANNVSGSPWVEPIAIIPVGAGPEFGIGVNTVTNRVYVANTGSNTVSVIYDPPKALQFSGNNFAFLARPSQAPPFQSLVVSVANGDSVPWAAAITYDSGSGWLAPTPLSGTTTPMPVTLGINTAPGGVPLAVGNYSARITFSASGVVNSPQTVSVTLAIADSFQQLYLPALYKSMNAAW